MTTEDLINKVQTIVDDAKELVETHMEYRDLPVNYACIFAQNEDEYITLSKVVEQLSIKILKDTPSGFLYQIKPIKTNSGTLQILKIRKPDPTRPELGDADFTVKDFNHTKDTYLSKEGYKLIPKDNFVMIELYDKNYNVRAYFSNPPLDEQFDLV